MPSPKPKGADVAAEAKKHFIPIIQNKYAHQWPTHSYVFQNPQQQIPLSPQGPSSAPNTEFYVRTGDPVDFALDWIKRVQTRVPFICVAHDKRPGGDWEVGASGYEERLCKRSTLSATLTTPGPKSPVDSNYPIPSEGGIYSEFVVVFRGPNDHYKELDRWYDLPVVSMPAIRRPKLSQDSLRCVFPLERDLVRNKIRSALRICAYYGHRSVVIGDWGLGNTYRNPPQELAEIWREVFLFDPDLRGRFDHVAFVIDDAYQSTTRLIIGDMAKKYKSGQSSSSKGKSTASTSSQSYATGTPTDFDIFQHVFSVGEIRRLTNRPDPRYDISMLTS